MRQRVYVCISVGKVAEATTVGAAPGVDTTLIIVISLTAGAAIIFGIIIVVIRRSAASAASRYSGVVGN